MNSFIKSVKSVASNKETVIKKSITTQLSNTVKEIQFYVSDEGMSNDSLQVSEAENALCSAIEGMFLHGLKDSLVHRARRAIADIDERPEPSFWAPLLLISHRQIIDQISKLSQITTEIGQCRAWIRIALNDCLLSSYVSTMRSNSSMLKSYYNSYAYVRDSELLDIAQRLIEGVETFKEFNLPSNSSLLNAWHLQSLVLAGIWSPTLRTCPVAAGVDVAQSLQSNTSVNTETGSMSSSVSFTSLSFNVAPLLNLSEDEALKIILAKHSAEPKLTSTPPTKPALFKKISASDLLQTETASESEAASVVYPVSNLGNSLNRKSGWSFSEDQQKNEAEDEKPTSTAAVSASIDIEGAKSVEGSYNALIESYNLLEGSYIKTPNIREVWQQFEGGQTDEEEQETRAKTPQLSRSVSVVLPLTECVGTIAQERGLDMQNFDCSTCKKPLGVQPKPKFCNFMAEYVCDNCMASESIPLPARIIRNWDFKPYPVSIKAFNYVKEFADLPLIDLKVVNPYIYSASPDMSKLQTLRIQLNILRDYLFTCREPVREELQKQICGKEYMYEHVHQYSISDLQQIRNGALALQLQKVVTFATEHVQNCWLCSQKGFICEICDKPKVLYPFDVSNVYRCNNCNAVYHNSCLNSTKPCPKCKRKKEREDLSLFGATMEHIQ